VVTEIYVVKLLRITQRDDLTENRINALPDDGVAALKHVGAVLM